MSFLSDLKSFIFVLPTILKRRKKEVTLPQFLMYEQMPQDSFSRFVKQAVAAGVALLVITSIAPSTLLETGVSADILGTDDNLIIDDPFIDESYYLPKSEDGFFLKMNPQEENVDRMGFTDKVKHVVESGETLSEIANRYNLNVSTLVWENNLGERDKLSVGQTLIIPPVDGVNHKVAGTGATLNKIAKLYGVDVDVIKTHNQLTDDTIQKGQSLFIPGGKPLATEREVAARSTRNRVAYDTFEPRSGMGSTGTPSSGKSLIFPTTGSISRGFSGGHYGLDIGNRSRPDVWASAEGVVIKTTTGCPQRNEEVQMKCGGGYGNNIIIDHGNGLKTLYGHMDTLYVTEGQKVASGQLIGSMGNSGRVFGPTGIHLHWEVIDNGVKRNPRLYY